MAQKDREGAGPAVKNIYLVGFMCAGKTLTGRALAALLKRPFRDSDLAVEKACGAKIAVLVEKKGLGAFRKAEAAAVEQLTARTGGVAALGGGVYPSRRWKGRLRASGVTVYLHCPWPELKQRLGSARAGRPLLNGTWARTEKLYRRRLGFYRQAELELNTAGLTPEAAARELKKKLAL